MLRSMRWYFWEPNVLAKYDQNVSSGYQKCRFEVEGIGMNWCYDKFIFSNF